MGYLKAGQETDRLTLPSDSDYYVVMKRRATYGDQLAAQAAVVKMDSIQPGAANMMPALDTAAYVQVLVTRLVVEWNLTDENDQPLPCTRENLERLEPADGEFLANEANRRLGARPQEQQAPFRNGSGQHSTATGSGTPKSRR